MAPVWWRTHGSHPRGPCGATSRAVHKFSWPFGGCHERTRMVGLVCERHQAPTLLSLLHMCEQPVLLLCRLSLVQFVTYNPELQVFTASMLRFSFQETGSIRVSLARCWSCHGLGLIAIVAQDIHGATHMRQHRAWPPVQRQSCAAPMLLQQASWPCPDTAQPLATGRLPDGHAFDVLC